MNFSYGEEYSMSYILNKAIPWKEVFVELYAHPKRTLEPPAP